MPATQRKEEPDTDLPWPDFDVLDGGNKGDGSSTPERDSVRALNDLEQNPDEAPSADEDVGEQEEAGGGADATEDGTWANKTAPGQGGTAGGKISGLKGFTKKKGPMAAIIGLLLGGGSVGMIILSPAALLFNLKETLFDDLDYQRNGMHIRTNRVVYHKYKKLKNGFEFSSEGKCNIRCKFGTISRGMKDNLEAKGFRLTVDEGKGLFKNRYVIKELISPTTGKSVSNAKDFNDMMNNGKDRALINKILRYKTMYFLNTKYGKILKQKFGINKLSKLRSDLTEKAKTKADAYKQSLRKALGLKEKPPGTPSKLQKLQADPKIQTAVGKISNIGNKISDISSAVCGIYSMGKTLNYVLKITKYSAFVAFAYTFLTEIDKIKAGDADPDVVSNLGAQFTELDFDGLAATDSIGYRMSAHGDVEPLSKSDKEANLKPDNNFINSVNAIISSVKLTGNIIMAAVAICTTANIAGPILACLPAALGGEVATPAGAVAAFLACVAGQIGASVALGLAVSWVLGMGIRLLADNYMPVLDEETIGRVLGNVTQAGTNQNLGGTAASYGLSAAKDKTAIKQYVVDTAEVRRQQQEIAVYEAKDTPFDVYNKYSFLGSIVNSLHLETFYGVSSPATVMKKIMGLVPQSIASLNSNVNAIASTKPDNYYDQCDDPSLTSIGINAADAFCNPYYIMDSTALGLETEDVLDYMIDNNYIIEDTGEPNPDRDYQKYLDNCANRMGPLGDTDEATLDSVLSFRNGEGGTFDGTVEAFNSVDYGWKIGLFCVQQDGNSDEILKQNKMLSYFSAYNADFSAMETIDDDAMYTETAMEYKEKGITFYEPDDYQSKIAQELKEMQQAWENEDLNISNTQDSQQKQQSTSNKKPSVNVAKAKTCDIGSYDSQIFDLNILCGRAYPGIVKKQGYAI